MREIKVIPVAGHPGSVTIESDDVFGGGEYYLTGRSGCLFLEFSHGFILKLVSHGDTFKAYEWRPPEYSPTEFSAKADETLLVTGEFDWVRAWANWLPNDEEIILKMLAAFPNFDQKRFAGDMEELDQWYNREAVKFRNNRTAARLEAAG